MKRLAHHSKRPITRLQNSVNNRVTVRLKNNEEYKGMMRDCDPYMNVILIEAEEFRNSVHTANYGGVLIKGNNILFIKFEEAL